VAPQSQNVLSTSLGWNSSRASRSSSRLGDRTSNVEGRSLIEVKFNYRGALYCESPPGFEVAVCVSPLSANES
jgi:hypothetical protein